MSRRIVLVTGGAGFVGSNIVAELAANSFLDIAVCDRLHDAASGKWRNLAKHAIAEFVFPEDLWSWLEARGGDVEMVIHMGAVSSTMEEDADKIIQTNFSLSCDIFRWCAEQRRRFLYASSGATYGDGAIGFDDAQDVRSLSALRPRNAYGWSKALFDVFVAREAARGTAPPQTVGLKFFNVYGPNEEHKGDMRSMVSKMWAAVAAGEPVRLFRSYRDDVADGGQRRDFIYVRDIVRVVDWLCERPDVNGVFNLGSGEARSFTELANAVFKAAGREPRIEYVDMPPAIRDEYQYFTQARTERLRAAGYSQPFTRLEDGVLDYVERFLSRPDPYL